jgi:hypothetical protein
MALCQQVISEKALAQLKEISGNRKKNGSLCRAMKDVASEAIEQLHKKEFK